MSITVGDEKIEINVIKFFLNDMLSGRINKDNVKNKYVEENYDAKKLLDEALVKKIQKLDQN